MKRTDFTAMCTLAKDGRLTWVENTTLRETGRVMTCGRETMTVDVGGRREDWHPRDCRELTHGYKINYDEVRKYPDEFDTHRD